MANFLVANIDSAGIGSLRDAIMNANAAPGLDTIVFDTAGLFATPQTISLLDELPAITDSVDISGTGSAMLTIQRDPGTTDFGIFDVENAAATTPISVIISGLTLSGGARVSGGAIRSVGENLSLDGIVVSRRPWPSFWWRSEGAWPPAFCAGTDWTARPTCVPEAGRCALAGALPLFAFVAFGGGFCFDLVAAAGMRAGLLQTACHPSRRLHCGVPIGIRGRTVEPDTNCAPKGSDRLLQSM